MRSDTSGFVSTDTVAYLPNMSQSKQTTTASRDQLRPSTTIAALKYLTVRPERIAAVTLRELAACGIPERALGLVSNALRVTLVGCVALNDNARSYLPAELGGTAAGLNASDDTLDLADAFFARSPPRQARSPFFRRARS